MPDIETRRIRQYPVSGRLTRDGDSEEAARQRYGDTLTAYLIQNDDHVEPQLEIAVGETTVNRTFILFTSEMAAKIGEELRDADEYSMVLPGECNLPNDVHSSWTVSFSFSKVTPPTGDPLCVISIGAGDAVGATLEFTAPQLQNLIEALQWFGSAGRTMLKHTSTYPVRIARELPHPTQPLTWLP